MLTPRASFYTLVGAHALHVLAALVVLAVVLRRAATGHFQPGEASARFGMGNPRGVIEIIPRT